METFAALLGGYVGFFMGMYVAARVSDDKELFFKLATLPSTIFYFIAFLATGQSNTSVNTVVPFLVTGLLAGIGGLTLQQSRDKRAYG